jgi:hypothetical protein
MSNVNVVWKGVGTILSINKYFLSFLCGFLWPQFRNLIVTLCIWAQMYGLFITIQRSNRVLIQNMI